MNSAYILEWKVNGLQSAFVVSRNNNAVYNFHSAHIDVLLSYAVSPRVTLGIERTVALLKFELKVNFLFHLSPSPSFSFSTLECCRSSRDGLSYPYTGFMATCYLYMLYICTHIYIYIYIYIYTYIYTYIQTQTRAREALLRRGPFSRLPIYMSKLPMIP